MRRLLRELHTVGILTEDLALPEDPDDLEAIYRGLCHLPHIEGSRRRRIDFLSVPWTSRGAALLYYTVCFCSILLGEHSSQNKLFTPRVTISYVAWHDSSFFSLKPIFVYFQFNRAIRLKANVLGYSLNQKGLFGNVVRNPRDRRVKLEAGE
jgi:DNA polymerase lambda